VGFRFPLDDINVCNCILQLMMIMLPQLRESYYYLVGSEHAHKSILDHDAFVDVFGHLVDDADLHFSDFRASEVATCDPMEVFCVMGLFCCDTIQNKFEFLVSMHVDHKSKRLKGSGFFLLLRRIVFGLNRVLGMPTVDTNTLAGYVNTLIAAYAERNIFAPAPQGTDGTGVTDEAKVVMNDSPDKESPWSYLITNTSIRFTFEEIYQFFQDTTDTNQFLEKLSVFCSTCLSQNERWRAMHPMIALKDILIAEVSREATQFNSKASVSGGNTITCLNRPRNPLWGCNIANMLRESWFASMPMVFTDDLVYTALEHIILSGGNAVPVFSEPVNSKPSYVSFQTPKSTNKKQISRGGSGDGGPAFFPPNNRSNSNNKSTPNTHSTIGGWRSPRGITSASGLATATYYGVLDLSSVLLWIALNCPETLVAKIAADELKRRDKCKRDLEQHLMLTKGISTPSNSSSSSAGHRKPSEAVSANARGNHYHHESIILGSPMPPHLGSNNSSRSASINNLSDTAGRSGSKSNIPMLGALGRQDSGGRGGATHWQAIGERIAASTIADALNTLTTNNTILNTNSKHHAMLHSPPVLQTDQFLYDLILCIARGYRSIPISFTDQPSGGGSGAPHPNYVISDTEVVSFLCENAVEVLGGLAKVQIKNCEFMKYPVTIPNNMNLGCAIYSLACRGVDSAVILDNNGKIGGRFIGDHIVRNMWFEWKRQVLTTESRIFTSNRSLNTFSSDTIPEGGTSSSGPRAAVTLESLRQAYREQGNQYEVFDGSSNNVFSMYSCLLTPLKACQDFGVQIIDFERTINRGVGADNSDSDDSENSNSDSDDDGSDDGGKRHKSKPSP
jgi:hypothetical protein